MTVNSTWMTTSDGRRCYRRGASAILAVLVLAVLLTGCGPAAGVPQVASPAPSSVLSPAPVASPPKEEFSSCAAASLAGRLGDVSLGTGVITHYLVLTNSGREPCTLDGGPASVTAVEPDGTQVTLTTTYASGDGFLAGPANLRPGQSGQVALSTTAFCSDPGSPVTYSSVSVVLPDDGGSVVIDLGGGLPLDAGCGVGASQFGVKHPQRR
jgi:hypothetical protein